MAQQEQDSRLKILLMLGAIWLLTTIFDRLWFALDNSVPAWDQADYLTGSLNYWQALQQPQWFSEQWWRDFWQISSKIPPLFYIATAIIQQLVGTGQDQATLVLPLFTAILIISVYGLGHQLFNSRIGLWAALLSVILPGLYRYRLEFLLDYPLTVAVTFSFFCLTTWRSGVMGRWEDGGNEEQGSRGAGEARGDKKQTINNFQFSIDNLTLKNWLWALAFGLSFGLALMVKQTALLFLLIPIIWVIITNLRHRCWVRLGQLAAGLFVSLLIFYPWYRLNWLLILTSGKRATIDSAIAEGDPALNSLDAWLYYGKILPYLLSWPLLLVSIAGLIFYAVQKLKLNTKLKVKQDKVLSPSSLRWLTAFLLGGYLLCSLNLNKDARYILPLLPVLSLYLAYGLTRWTGRWRSVPWLTVSLVIILMLFNLFPLGKTVLTQVLSPRVQHQPYQGKPWPHRQVIAEIIKNSPYLRTNLGVLPSTPEINQHNFNYYGALANFQVYGRQVGTQEKQVTKDTRSLSWFLTKTGNQGSVPAAQTTTVQLVENGSDFQLHNTWQLPDTSLLKLYHRLQPFVQVQPLPEFQIEQAGTRIQLKQVKVPATAPPGVPIPVTYQWTGSWQQLQSGIVILTWQSTETTAEAKWLHDHSIGMWELDFSLASTNLLPWQGFRVIEKMSMLPPANLPFGIYNLTATYLNQQTGETYPISVPEVRLKIEPQAEATPAPELDLVSQLRTLAKNLPKGVDALDTVFAETGRINQYDPIQDYLTQVELALEYRLKLEPENLELTYALALAEVLQADVEGAIAALKRVVLLDSQNPYAHAYLAFVYLYDWRGKEAEAALRPAIYLNPHLPEVQTLSGIAAVMQGNIFKALRILLS